MRWAVLAFVCVAAAQESTPHVELLARIQAHARQELARVPNYTCLETIARFRKDSRSKVMADRILKPLDTVRLEIVFADHHEWYGSPGERNLGTDNPTRFIGGGMISSGAFAGMLNNILAAGAYTYGGEEWADGRRAARYDFRLARDKQTLTISLPLGQGTVGQEGSLWADPESLDLIRVESRASEIPPLLPLMAATTTVTYSRMRVGEYNALMAQQAESHMWTADGVESFNRMDFTHCRAYAAQSEIRYDIVGLESDGASTAAAKPAPASVPPFLMLPTELVTPVTDKDLVGTLIQARVTEDAVHKSAVAVPAGSIVHGRIRRLERYAAGHQFIVGLEFDEVEVRGRAIPFYADLLRLEKDPRIRPVLKERILIPDRSGVHEGERSITLPELAGVASFFVSGDTFALRSGFKLVWRTRGAIAGFDHK
jgi:hypothetical protein